MSKIVDDAFAYSFGIEDAKKLVNDFLNKILDEKDYGSLELRKDVPEMLSIKEAAERMKIRMPAYESMIPDPNPADEVLLLPYWTLYIKERADAIENY